MQIRFAFFILIFYFSFLLICFSSYFRKFHPYMLKCFIACLFLITLRTMQYLSVGEGIYTFILSHIY
ncbi:hypothetical protein RchiOBHm_Chr2g0148021 [Rosa chinensis]|uniref:Uncharacterized protein n=1 Tax=Rosa chinensis TaxID=74649 RepID=A0A2P6RZC8_ROSCH|nr:hypothetical protein RchiOBHm_Chr2g0148021 [Rosa chinensis]